MNTRLIGCSAAGWTGLYGALKLYWATGGTALRDLVEVPGGSWTDPRFVLFGLWGTVLLAVIGMVVACAAVHPPRPGTLRRLVRVGCWFAATILTLRAVPALVLDPAALAGFVGDQPLTADEVRMTRLDLTLWTPFFAVWAALWLGLAITTRTRQAGPPLTGAVSGRP
ncbi:MAG: DUF3995 domain-containing protein [Kineosporiaceae bacterium]|jgi:hypothetical protein